MNYKFIYFIYLYVTINYKFIYYKVQIMNYIMRHLNKVSAPTYDKCGEFVSP